jgi:hypothetical protein
MYFRKELNHRKAEIAILKHHIASNEHHADVNELNWRKA